MSSGRHSCSLGMGRPVVKHRLLYRRGHRLERLDDVVVLDDRYAEATSQRIAEPGLAGRPADQQHFPGGMRTCGDLDLLGLGTSKLGPALRADCHAAGHHEGGDHECDQTFEQAGFRAVRGGRR